MDSFLVLGLLALVVCGFVGVVWGAFGGPRWVRAISSITLGLVRLLLGSNNSRRRTGGSTLDSD
ncbi:hypothetical protein [Streptomyces sp. NPDC002588]|uniref:hypothetical protein n=1 Tax=Streptomyces sp. NPDC002588 TaxID=3154419 RepID=UPI00332D2817